MKRLLILAPVALALASCNGMTDIPTAPGQIAQHTAADEQAMLRAEQAYKLSRTIGELGVDAGLIRGETATRLAALDQRLYQALLAARTAYRGFNSSDLLAAANEVSSLADQIQAIVQGDRQ